MLYSMRSNIRHAPVMELVDMRDLGSRAFSVWVRVPSGAPKRTTMTKSHGVSFYTSFIQMEKRTKRRMANAIPLCCTIQKNLNALPVGAVLGVHDLDALSLQLIADAVGLREVLGLLGLVALHDQRVNGGIALAGDGVAAFGLGGLGLGIGFPHRCGLFQQGQAQIVYYDGMIYGIDDTGIFSKGNRTYNLMEITADGENRDKKAVIETDGNNFLIHRNQIFTTYIDEDDHGVITAFDLETGKQESIYRSEWNMSQIMDLYAYEDRLYFSETGVDDNETYIAALDCTDLITGETVENLLQNSTEIEDSEAYVVGISDEKLYIRISSMDTMKSDIYVCDLDGTDAKYITQMSIGQTVMDDENIYLASFEDNQIYVYTKEGEQVSVIAIEEKSQDERHLLDVNPVAGSGQYGFISCFFGMTDGQIYRSILAFDKEKLEMGNAALQTIVEGSLYDMH